MEPPNVKYMSTGITRSHISGQLLLDLASSQDFSNWTFTYNSSYHAIQEGINDLTSKTYMSWFSFKSACYE